MSDERPDADQVADLLLPLRGPYHPDRVIEAAWTVAELVRRLNHATLHAHALRYPPQVNRTIAGLRSALHGLEQTFDQIATRLDAFSTNPQVEHDLSADPAATCREAAIDLRQAAAGLGEVTAPLTRVGNVTSHLGYDTTRRGPFPPPQPPHIHKGPNPAGQAGGDPAAPPTTRTGRSR